MPLDYTKLSDAELDKIITSSPEQPKASKQPDSIKADPDNPSGLLRRAADVGVGLVKGVAKLPQAITGLADIPTGGKVGKLVEDVTGYSGKAVDKAFNPYLSPETSLAQEKVSKADGFADTISTALQNPSSIVHAVAESLPSMYGGGILGKAVAKGAGLMKGVAAAEAIGVAAKGNPYSLTKGLADQVAKESTRAAAIGEGAVMIA